MATRRAWPRAPVGIRLAPTLLVALFAASVASGPIVPQPLLVGASLAVSGAAAGVAAVRVRGAALALVAVALAIAGAGAAWGGARSGARATTPVAVPTTLAGIVAVDEPPKRRAAGQQAVVVVDSGTPLRAGSRLLADFPRAANLRAGDRLRVAGRVVPPARPDAPEWWRRTLQRRRIVGRMRIRGLDPVGRRTGILGARDRWRTWVRANAGNGAAGDARALVRGMSIGATDELSAPRADDLRAAGLWHLVAVSGQNVAIVAGALLLVLIAMGVRRPAAAATAVVVVVLYTVACDGGASVARAGIMGVVGLSAVALGSAVRRWHVLFVGLAVLLAWAPDSATDPGLQLSFAATAGLMALGIPIARALAGWVPSALGALVGQSIAASVATAPVLAANFGQLSLVGIVLNVVAVPLAAPIVILALVGLVAGAVIPGAGVPFAWAAARFADVLLAVARLGANAPGATLGVRVGDVAVASALAAIVVAAVVVYRRSGPGPIRSRALVVAAAAVALGAAILPVGRDPARAPWPTRPAVTALSVGQGDAILLTDGAGTAILVDTGPPATRPPVLAALERRGVRRLDAVLITHGQSDHDAGAGAVLDRLPVGRLIVPPLAGRSPGTDAAFAAARRRGIPLDRPEAGALVRAGAWTLRVLSPLRAPTPGDDPNRGALVVDATAGAFRVLLTADAESDVLGTLPLDGVDVLKVAHHGSGDPGLGRILDVTRPGVALISVGPNTFGHPTPSTIAELRSRAVTTLRTDVDGDSTVWRESTGLNVSATNRVGR